MKKILFYLMAFMLINACNADISTLPTSVLLDQEDVTIVPGETIQLNATVIPDEAAIKNLTWNSSNPDVATVTDGVVTANLQEGSTLITVTTNSGQKMAVCTVWVSYPVSGVTLNRGSTITTPGKIIALTATVLPDDAPDKSISWESSNPDVAAVTDNGVVITKNRGTAVISVITEVGRRRATFTVKVVPENTQMITMTGLVQNSVNVRFILTGYGLIDIDWGNGVMLLSQDHSGYRTITYEHNYNPNGSDSYYNVTIAGEYLSEFSCHNFNITNLDVSAAISLESLSCRWNQLTNLDVSNNRSLTFLECDNNLLTSLDLRNNRLRHLGCGNNLLTSMELINHSSSLQYLYCQNNQLKSLDTRAHPGLIHIFCQNNELTSLYVSSANSALRELRSASNQLSAEALNSVFSSLNDAGAYKIITINDNPGANTCDRSIATNKGWFVY